MNQVLDKPLSSKAEAMYSSEVYLGLTNLVKAYPNPYGEDIAVVDGFDLNIPKGGIFSVIGHSGCGKSTVLTMIAGLNPITSGKIQLEGKDITSPGPDRAVVFQHLAFSHG